MVNFSIIEFSSNSNIKQSHRSHMDLHIQNIQQTTSSGRLVLSKSYQRLTPDPKITNKSNIKDQGKFNTTQVVHFICHGVHELPFSSSPPDILVYVTQIIRETRRSLLPHRHQYLIHNKHQSIHYSKCMNSIPYHFIIQYHSKSDPQHLKVYLT